LSILVLYRVGDDERRAKMSLWRLPRVGSNMPLDQCASVKPAAKEAPPIPVSSRYTARWTPAGQQQSLGINELLAGHASS